MLEYVLKRLLQLIPIIIGVSLVVFITMRVLPGDVATLLLGDRATAEQLTKLRHQLGLDKPIYIQYLTFVEDAAEGDFGESLRTNQPAIKAVLEAFPVTIQLTFAALLIASLCGVALGVLAALRPSSWLDNIIMVVTLLGVSMPIFWSGLMLILLFGGILGWLPLGGTLPIGQGLHRVTGMTVIDSLIAGNWGLFVTSLKYLLLPALTLSTIPLALITRIMRSEMLTVISHDFVRTARAKGLSERLVIYKHALRNAFIPVLTVIGLQFGILLSGAVLTETIFSLPGLGRLIVNSVLNRDYPVVQAIALTTAIVFVLVNLLVDLAYALIDPRIQYQ